MKKYVCLAMAYYLLLLTPPATFGQQTQKRKLDDLFDWLSKNDQAMGSICVMKNGVVAYQRAIGFRTVRTGEKILANVDTKYRIWSITKMYTATMILQAIAEGKISLKTSLAKYFPQVTNADSITIANMLGHTSGIHDFTHPVDSLKEKVIENDPGIVGKIASYPADFFPGERVEYSNSNYVLLGYILERLEKKSYEKILTKRIADVIGLENTYYGSPTLKKVVNKAETYQYANDAWQYVDEGEFGAPIPGPAGGIVATPTDMAKFIYSLFNGKLLASASLAQMTTMRDMYGFGIFNMPFLEKEGFGHGGGYLASHAMLTYYPDDKLAIAYCTNGVRYGMQSIISAVLNIFSNEKYVLPFTKTEEMLSHEDLRKYEGNYTCSRFDIKVTVVDGRLSLVADGQPTLTLRAEHGTNRFYFLEGDMQVEFDKNEDGMIYKLALIMGDTRRVEANRLP
ncbi:serine hydrolase [Pseudochryseolinea flava]|uniref:Beta-lactamase-related domain-containing protein n=1 Tax=Pseudochryseolinea flava TaxID=2059302 RepID=A0A364Y709_9BACT|nr:serine hydrolase [Pseudochryseolinea flava]RAW02894.1 hypothetical protein DQQ10_01945 [Pseudochryseolinea flava]